jgi:hypothetical protein
MGYPQANQQTGYIGYPMNQLYNPADLQYMQNTQRDFMNWGNWQPGMTRTSQWLTDPAFNDPSNYGMQGLRDSQQTQLNEYYRRVGNPYEQAQRQGYWEQMGGQTYGGVIPPTDNPLVPVAQQAYERQANTPWGDLNNMGVSAAYGMPAWQQASFASQNATPGGGQDPMEQFNLVNSGSTSLSGYGIPSGFIPAEQATPPDPMLTPGYGDPRPQDPMAPAAPEWMYPQRQNSWGNNSGNPWGHSGGWGGRGWGR